MIKESGISLGIILIAVITGLILNKILFFISKRVADKTSTNIDNVFIRHLYAPVRLILPLLLILVITPSLHIPDYGLPIFRHIFSLLIICAITWLLVRTTIALRDAVHGQYDLGVADNLNARAVHTQINVLAKIALVAIAVISISSLLMTFEKVRQVGVTLLASAGLAGIIIGFAAQKTISTILAGFQIAITQPIRIDDVVIVENEWGWVEEITLTYVVVRIWDLRRIVLPITYFIEKPFQNWTRKTAELLGTVFIYADYTVPVEKVREHLKKIVSESDLWDGKVCGLQVTKATEHTVELRALMSSADASKGWDLRCHVREKLLKWLQETYPESLPKVRAELKQGNVKDSQV